MDMDRIQTIAVKPILDTKTKNLILTGTLILIPLIWSGPQLLIGSVVNLLLCLTAATSQPRHWYLKAALPSLAVIIHGVLFSSFTIYLLYLWPIITLGNWVYMSVNQSKLKVLSKIKLPAAAIIKTLILIAGATLLFQLKMIPAVLVNSMGTIQLVTALIGGLIAATI